jgi:septum formation protein
MKLLLASNSPRRKELLIQLGYQFEVVKIDVDESYPSNLRSDQIAEYISEKKQKLWN